MIFQHTSFRTYLKAVLAERRGLNPGYSLRAFARQLDVSSAVLSQVMSAKRNFSPKLALKVAERLKLNEDENQYFCLLAQYEAASVPSLKAQLHSRLLEAQNKREKNGIVPHDYSVEIFKLISDWYHLPIVEMTELKDFKFTAENIAQRLGITKNQAEVAIERLERLEMIEQKPEGGYRKTHLDIHFRSEVMNAALNSFHRQMIGRAGDAVAEQKREERFIGSNTIAIDPKLLPKATELIAKFRDDLVELFNSGDKNTEVYHLGMQLFRLTKPEDEKD